MAKSKKDKNVIVINANNIDKALDALKEIQKPFEITSASIKEAQCNYGYEIKTGPTAGDKIPNRKGSSYVHQDMYDAFKALNVHLAFIDDAFKYSGKEVASLDEVNGDEIAELFTVTGFKISGNEENEGFIIIGEKWVTTGSIGLESPKISASSNYLFFDQLKEDIEAARTEVELYMNGKAAPKMEQGEIEFPEGESKEDAFDKPL